MPGGVYQQCGASVQWYSSAFCPWLPEWQTCIVTNVLWSLCKEELTRLWQFLVICLEHRVHKDLGVFMFSFLCDHLLMFPGAYGLTCSCSPVFSSDCAIFPCWCLLEELLDSFGDWVISKAATQTGVNLIQEASGYIPMSSFISSPG